MLDLSDYTTLWDHIAAWSVYVAAAFVLLLAYSRLTRRWQFDVRWWLFTLLAVFLLVPAPVPGSGRHVLAPAMIMLALSPFTGTPELLAMVLARLVVVAVAVVVLMIIVSAIRRVRLRQH